MTPRTLNDAQGIRPTDIDAAALRLGDTDFAQNLIRYQQETGSPGSWDSFTPFELETYFRRRGSALDPMALDGVAYGSEAWVSRNGNSYRLTPYFITLCANRASR